MNIVLYLGQGFVNSRYELPSRLVGRGHAEFQDMLRLLRPAPFHGSLLALGGRLLLTQNLQQRYHAAQRSHQVFLKDGQKIPEQ